MTNGMVLLILFAWILWLSVVCDRSQDVTQNWRRWSHIQWAAGVCIVFASPSWQFSLLFLVLVLAYWLPHVEAKSGALNDWFIKVFLFAAFYVVVVGHMEKWMLPWILLFILVCGGSVAFWIGLVKCKGPKYQLNVLGRMYPSFETRPERDEPTPGGFNCHGRLMNSVHSGAYGSVCLFASLGLGIIWHPAWFLSSALGIFILWGSGSRGGALNVLIAGVAWIAAGGPYRNIMIAVVVLSILLATYKKTRDWSWGGNVSSWRFQVWRDSIYLCLGNPLKAWRSAMYWIIGTGPFGWQSIAEPSVRKYGGRNWLSPHNEFVHVLCEHGLLGTFALLAFIYWLMTPSLGTGDAYGVAYLSILGVLVGTALWSFPWRGTALIEGATGRFIDGGIIKGKDGEDKKILRPETHFASAGAPIFTWLTAIWAVLGPHMG